MNAIPAGSSSATVSSLPTANLQLAPTAESGSGASSGDALALMRPSMDAAFAIGRPVNSGGAAGILAAGTSYVQGATATLSKLDEGIANRSRSIEQLKATDPTAARAQQDQIDMLQRLRDRIQLSIERVSRSLAGDVDPDEPESAARSTRRLNDARHDLESKRKDQLEALQMRQQLLMGAEMTASGMAPVASAVAGTYAAGGGTAT